MISETTFQALLGFSAISDVADAPHLDVSFWIFMTPCCPGFPCFCGPFPVSPRGPCSLQFLSPAPLGSAGHSQLHWGILPGVLHGVHAIHSQMTLRFCFPSSQGCAITCLLDSWLWTFLEHFRFQHYLDYYSSFATGCHSFQPALFPSDLTSCGREGLHCLAAVHLSSRLLPLLALNF